jgi:hypothetical protein
MIYKIIFERYSKQSDIKDSVFVFDNIQTISPFRNVKEIHNWIKLYFRDDVNLKISKNRDNRKIYEFPDFEDPNKLIRYVVSVEEVSCNRVSF